MNGMNPDILRALLRPPGSIDLVVEPLLGKWDARYFDGKIVCGSRELRDSIVAHPRRFVIRQRDRKLVALWPMPSEPWADSERRRT